MDQEVTHELVVDVQKTVQAQSDMMMGMITGVIVLFLLLAVFAGYVVKHLRDENHYLKREILKIRERERSERAQVFQELVESVGVLRVVVGALDKMLEWFKSQIGAKDDN